MTLYINGASCISPQHTGHNAEWLNPPVVFNRNRLSCIDVDYAPFFDAGSLRRMGRLMKYGTAAGLMAMREAGVTQPGAICTGTALGLPEVSQKFLKSLIEAEETVVSPTAFIQSTHNTVSANIALLTSCHAHNYTFSHKAFSFESALTDAILLSAESVDDLLVGAYDEVSDYKYASLRKAGELMPEPLNSEQLYSGDTSGIIAGEGSAFFMLSKNKRERSYAAISLCSMFTCAENTAISEAQLHEVLATAGISAADVDVLLLGVNGNKLHDVPLNEWSQTFFASATHAAYKHLCGEYMTASAFACWAASQIIRSATVPQAMLLKDAGRQPHNVLVYNVYKQHHTLMLLRHV